jgi:hypothetical protein
MATKSAATKSAATKSPVIKTAATKTAAIKAMAGKAKIIRPGMATPQKDAEAPDKETPETADAPLPLLDLSDAAVKKMIKSAKKRGYVTYEQLNAVMPSEEVTSEKIEDILAMMNEMGINVVETEEAETEEGEGEEAEEEETEGGEVVEVAPKVPAKSEAKEPTERTDDPVRMYLREMGSVELLSREGEIAIAKRIEAGREAMIAGLCESPLTFQAVIIWRDELNEGKVFLRDIIDLEATYAGPDAKQVAPAVAPGGGEHGGHGCRHGRQHGRSDGRRTQYGRRQFGRQFGRHIGSKRHGRRQRRLCAAAGADRGAAVRAARSDAVQAAWARRAGRWRGRQRGAAARRRRSRRGRSRKLDVACRHRGRA